MAGLLMRGFDNDARQRAELSAFRAARLDPSAMRVMSPQDGRPIKEIEGLNHGG